MGAAPSTTFKPVEDLPSLAGKVVIVTGSRYHISLFYGLETLLNLRALSQQRHKLCYPPALFKDGRKGDSFVNTHKNL